MIFRLLSALNDQHHPCISINYKKHPSSERQKSFSPCFHSIYEEAAPGRHDERDGASRCPGRDLMTLLKMMNISA